MAGGNAVRRNAFKSVGVVTPAGNPDVVLPLLVMPVTVMLAGCVVCGIAFE
jgi:hypothetical protein